MKTWVLVAGAVLFGLMAMAFLEPQGVRENPVGYLFWATAFASSCGLCARAAYRNVRRKRRERALERERDEMQRAWDVAVMEPAAREGLLGLLALVPTAEAEAMAWWRLPAGDRQQRAQAILGQARGRARTLQAQAEEDRRRGEERERQRKMGQEEAARRAERDFEELKGRLRGEGHEPLVAAFVRERARDLRSLRAQAEASNLAGKPGDPWLAKALARPSDPLWEGQAAPGAGRRGEAAPPSLRHLQEAFQRLKALLRSKGLAVDDGSLGRLVAEGLDEHELRHFMDRIQAAPDAPLDQLVEATLREYRHAAAQQAPLLRRLCLARGDAPPLHELQEALRRAEERQELAEFERRLRAPSAPAIGMQDIDQMDGLHFQRFLRELFARAGYRVQEPPRSGDQGADLLLEGLGERVAVQAKRYGSAVGNAAVQEVVAAVGYYKADRGMVVTNSTFTKSARQLAAKTGVELVDRQALQDLLSKHAM